MMITIGADFGGPTLHESPVGQIIRSAMRATARIRGDWVEGTISSVNVVFYVPGSVAQYEEIIEIRAARFSRKQKLLLVEVPVPKAIVDSSGSVEFLVDALHKANAIAAEVFARKGTEHFDFTRAEAIVDRVRDALVHEAEAQ